MSGELRALIVEDSETDAGLIVRELGKGGEEVEWRRVDHAAAMQAALAEGSWDVIVSWSLPRFSGAAALALLRESGEDIPFIVVSGSLNEEAAVDVMRAGAQDYILKDRLTSLGEAVQRELRDREVRQSRRNAE